jgi:hypothetical protein
MFLHCGENFLALLALQIESEIFFCLLSFVENLNLNIVFKFREKQLFEANIRFQKPAEIYLNFKLFS